MPDSGHGFERLNLGFIHRLIESDAHEMNMAAMMHTTGNLGEHTKSGLLSNDQRDLAGCVHMHERAVQKTHATGADVNALDEEWGTFRAIRL